MNSIKVPYSKTGFFSKTILDYLDGAEQLRDFYSYDPDVSSVPAIMKSIPKKKHIDRNLLADTILAQYNGHSPNQKILDNVELLRDRNTFTVTTAHQLNIFTGPLYYIYKIINTIRVASDLRESYPENNFIPCYWMGSEDHDFEEINHIRLFNKEIRWDNFQGGAMGSYSTDGLTGLLPQIREILRDGENLDDLISIMESAYSRPLLADAVRHMLDDLFGKFGLVVIDGNSKNLKAVFQDVILDELQNQTSEKLVLTQIETMANAGYKSQAGPREINLFYKEGRKRNRIMQAGNDYSLADDDLIFTEEEMMKMVEEHPERFSPNVILRPLHQQMVLPNIAYIGGSSEVAYWMQLKSLFDHYNVHFPMLLLRTSAQTLSAQAVKKLSKLNIDLSDIFLHADELKKNFVASAHDDLELEEEKNALKEIFKQLHKKALKIDTSLDTWIGAEEQKASKSLQNISKRLIKTGKAGDEQSMAQIDNLKARLFPSGGLQERQENFMSYYSDKGQEWFTDLLKTLDPFEKKFYLFY